MEKPSLPKGTRDFGPSEMIRRQFVFNTIKSVFRLFGFQPLETPAMENLSTLTGKYGDEGDQLLFKVLNSGDFMKDAPKGGSSKDILPHISEKGLRYDLTVPFARYVAMNRHAITFPFKRYQMQPVWRADRPQKGRYREFWQCDADVVGTDSLLCEAEILLMIRQVMNGLGFKDYTIRINHRGILSGIAESVGAVGKESHLFVAIDKLEKAGKEKVTAELEEKGFSPEQVGWLFTLLEKKGSNEEKLAFAKKDFTAPAAEKGIAAMEELLSMAAAYQADQIPVFIDFSLARGLSYYTGTIFEVVINNVPIGSVSGGGRYDNLTGVFGMPGVSGVGISFGVDRICDAMEALNLFPETITAASTVLIAHFDNASFRYGLPVLRVLRDSGIAAELYPEIAKLKKQLDYANKKHIPYVVVIGSDEMQSGNLALKDMTTGTQETIPVTEIVAKLAPNHAPDTIG